MKDEVTVKLEKTKCAYCGSETVSMEQYEENFKRYKHDSWVGLTDEDKKEYVAQDFGGNRLDAMDWAEKRLKEKNT